MSEKNHKLLCESICLLSIIFGVIFVFHNYKSFLWALHDISKENFLYFANIAIDVLFLVVSIFLLIAVLRDSYKRLKLVYGVLIAVGVLCFITRAPYIMELDSITDIYSLCYALQGILIASIAICLIISLKRRKKIWIKAILVQLVALPIVISVGAAEFALAVFQYVPVLIAGLIINMRIIEKAKYDDTTSALESLKKQYESGIISNEEYTLKKSELISKL